MSRRHSVMDSKDLERLRATHTISQFAGANASSGIRATPEDDEVDDMPTYTPTFKNETTLRIQDGNSSNLYLNRQLEHRNSMSVSTPFIGGTSRALSTASVYSSEKDDVDRNTNAMIHGRYQSRADIFQVYGRNLHDGFAEGSEQSDSFYDDAEGSPKPDLEIFESGATRRHSLQTIDHENDGDLGAMMERMRALESRIATKEEVIKKKDSEIGELTETRQRMEKTLIDTMSEVNGYMVLMNRYREEIQRLQQIKEDKPIKEENNLGWFARCSTAVCSFMQ